MQLDKIIQIRLLKQNYNKFQRYSYYKLRYVDKNNYTNFISDLNQVVTYIHKQLTNWDSAPTIEDVLKRFESNSHCLLFYYKDLCIGWNWGNPNVTIDWINNIQNLEKNELYGGGCFVTNLIDRPSHAGLINYNMIFEYWIDKLGYDTIYGYVDDWNRVALRVNFQNGLTIHNFLKN